MTISENPKLIPTYEQLKERHRACREAQPEAFSVRIHRALSWLRKAEVEQEDPDAQFIFLWIALNAAYATEFDYETPQLDQFRVFIDKLLAHDADNSVQKILFNQFHGPVRNIFHNKYLFDGFWLGLREHDATENWKPKWKDRNGRAMKAVVGEDTTEVICLLCSRLYVLRNQLVHGGATYQGRLNRAALTDANRILGTLVPIMISLMIPLDGEEFGEVAYPPFHVDLPT